MPTSRVARAIPSRQNPCGVPLAVLALLALAGTGCAIHRYDAATGTEHVWGIGHLSLRVQPVEEGRQAVITERSVAGLGLAAGKDAWGLSLGWDQVTRVNAWDDSVAVRVDWPTGSLADVRIGSLPPWAEPGAGAPGPAAGPAPGPAPVLPPPTSSPKP